MLWPLGHVRELGSYLEVFLLSSASDIGILPSFYGPFEVRSPTYTGFVIMCAGAAVMASLSPVRAVFTLLLLVVLALKLAEEEEALKAARPEQWAKYVENLGIEEVLHVRMLDRCDNITCKTLQDHFFLIESDNLDTSCRTSTMHNTLTRGKTKARNREVHSI